MFEDPYGKQVSLMVYDNEPTARMAEQRLNLEGIPCLVKSLGGGPGLWGTSYNLLHDLLVYERDQIRAREILKISLDDLGEKESVSQYECATPDHVINRRAITFMILIMVIFLVFILVTSIG